MSKFRVSILASVFALMLAVSFSAPSHAQISTEAIPKLLYVDSYFGTVANPSNVQAYFWGVVAHPGDSAVFETSSNTFFAYVDAVKFTPGAATITVEGFDGSGSVYFVGTIQTTSTGKVTVSLMDASTSLPVCSMVVQKTPGFIYILK